MPTPNAQNRRITDRRRRITVVLPTIFVGVVTFAAAAVGAAGVRDASSTSDRDATASPGRVGPTKPPPRRGRVRQATGARQTKRDTSPPKMPRRLSPTNATPTSLTASWRRSSDNVRVAGYEVSVTGRPKVQDDSNDAHDAVPRLWNDIPDRCGRLRRRGQPIGHGMDQRVDGRVLAAASTATLHLCTPPASLSCTTASS